MCFKTPPPRVICCLPPQSSPPAPEWQCAYSPVVRLPLNTGLLPPNYQLWGSASTPGAGQAGNELSPLGRTSGWAVYGGGWALPSGGVNGPFRGNRESRLIHQSVELQAALLVRLQRLLLVYIYIIIFDYIIFPLILHIEDDLTVSRSAVHFVKNDWSEHFRKKTSDCHITMSPSCFSTPSDVAVQCAGLEQWMWIIRHQLWNNLPLLLNYRTPTSQSFLYSKLTCPMFSVLSLSVTFSLIPYVPPLFYTKCHPCTKTVMKNINEKYNYHIQTLKLKWANLKITFLILLH